MKISYTSIFKREYKKLLKKHYNKNLFEEALNDLITYDSELLKRKYRDHALKGTWLGYRELHLSGDWLIIYRLDDKKIILTLVRTGSHDNLF